MARILVVDDDPNSRKIVELMLAVLGYELSFADNGLDAVQRAISDPPDLIVMDMLMPGLNGLEATQRIKAHPASRQVRILALSALAFESDKRDALACGCDAYMTKPFTRRELVAAVQEQLPNPLPNQALA